MIYQLGDKVPQIDNTVFIADDADVIGHVVLKKMPVFGLMQLLERMVI